MPRGRVRRRFPRASRVHRRSVSAGTPPAPGGCRTRSRSGCTGWRSSSATCWAPRTRSASGAGSNGCEPRSTGVDLRTSCAATGNPMIRTSSASARWLRRSPGSGRPRDRLPARGSAVPVPLGDGRPASGSMACRRRGSRPLLRRDVRWGVGRVPPPGGDPGRRGPCNGVALALGDPPAARARQRAVPSRPRPDRGTGHVRRLPPGGAEAPLPWCPGARRSVGRGAAGNAERVPDRGRAATRACTVRASLRVVRPTTGSRRLGRLCRGTAEPGPARARPPPL